VIRYCSIAATAAPNKRKLDLAAAAAFFGSGTLDCKRCRWRDRCFFVAGLVAATSQSPTN